jgi:6-phosphogluconate dehydrogenase
MGANAQIGVVGLGVMGVNLAKNVADHGHSVAGLDHHQDKADALSAHDNAQGTTDQAAFLDALERPRRVILLVPAGKPTEGAIETIAPHLEAGDILIDAGNANWPDTERRQAALAPEGIRFIGCGVSGGEVGARFGPSLMPGGEADAWPALKPLLQAIAAKVDPRTGREIAWQGDGPPPDTTNDPCVAWIGPGGSGHFVKMVHNGVEYADMQLICEAYHLLHAIGGLTPEEMAPIFARYNEGDLASFLIEITADILAQRDPVTGKPFVDVVLDTAGQKGTGKWTVTGALDFAQPAPTIAEAVFARFMSAHRAERVRASEVLRGPSSAPGVPKSELIEIVGQALLCAKICAYAQGFEIILGASRERGWNVDPASLARIWRGGCIIRAELLHQIGQAFGAEPDLPNLLLAEPLRNRIHQAQAGWRRAVALGAEHGVPLPALGSALAYYDSARSARLPANLLQAQRDFFGAHTYERVDTPAGTRFHLDWSSPDRSQREV